MSSSIEVMREEAQRFRSLADRLDALAAELAAHTQPVAVTRKGPTFADGGVAIPIPPNTPAAGEFAGMKQGNAILKALERYGPQTTTELFNRLNAGGMAFKKVVYVTAILPRLADRVERLEDGKIRLKTQIAT